MNDSPVEIEAEGITVSFDPVFGMIAELRVARHGRVVSMLHKAPWHGEPMQPGVAPHLGRLAGDFFCAPFGDASADGAPGHGWPANSLWSHLETRRAEGETVARFGLGRPTMGATLVKELRLVDNHPFLYQRHIFSGGKGAEISVANHAMLRLEHGAQLSFSPKRRWQTPALGLETDPARGRGLLAYPATGSNARRFPMADASSADLTRYPLGERHEDFVVGVEAPGRTFGWTSVARGQEQDLYLSLRNAARLPMTMLWFSNGGRDYAPWNGRHVNVLGVEEGINTDFVTDPADTGLATRTPGIVTGLRLTTGQTAEVRHVIGSVPWENDGEIAEIRPTEHGIVVRCAAGSQVEFACDLSFLHL